MNFEYMFKYMIRSHFDHNIRWFDEREKWQVKLTGETDTETDTVKQFTKLLIQN